MDNHLLVRCPVLIKFVALGNKKEDRKKEMEMEIDVSFIMRYLVGMGSEWWGGARRSLTSGVYPYLFEGNKIQSARSRGRKDAWGILDMEILDWEEGMTRRGKKRRGDSPSNAQDSDEKSLLKSHIVFSCTFLSKDGRTRKDT